MNAQRKRERISNLLCSLTGQRDSPALAPGRTLEPRRRIPCRAEPRVGQIAPVRNHIVVLAARGKPPRQPAAGPSPPFRGRSVAFGSLRAALRAARLYPTLQKALCQKTSALFRSLVRAPPERGRGPRPKAVARGFPTKQTAPTKDKPHPAVPSLRRPQGGAEGRFAARTPPERGRRAAAAGRGEGVSHEPPCDLFSQPAPRLRFRQGAPCKGERGCAPPPLQWKPPRAAFQPL